jgi:hypothetical protein
MSQNIRSVPVGSIYYQSGYGVPTHIATKGCTYIDILTATEYINKDSLVNWATMVDTTLYINNLGEFSGTSILITSTTKESIPFPKMTSVQRLAITLPVIGGHVYQTDGAEGVYVYKSTGWSFAY